MKAKRDHPSRTPVAALFNMALCIILVVLLLNLARYALLFQIPLEQNYNQYLLILFFTAGLMSWFWKKMRITRDRGWLIIALVMILLLDHVVSNLIFLPFFVSASLNSDSRGFIPLNIHFVLRFFEIAVIGIALVLGYFVDLLAPLWKKIESSGCDRLRPHGKLFDLLRVVLLITGGLLVFRYYSGIWEVHEFNFFLLHFDGVVRLFFGAGAMYFWMWLGPKSSAFRIRIASIIVVCDTLLMSFGPMNLFDEYFFAFNELIGGILGIVLGMFIYKTFMYDGGVGNRKRIELRKYILKKAFADSTLRGKSFKWAIIGVCFSTIMVIAIEIYIYFANLDQVPYFYYGILMVGLSIMFALDPFFRDVKQNDQRFVNQQPCFTCEKSCEKVVYDDDGWGQCIQCNKQVHAGQWIAPPVLGAEAKRESWKQQWRHQLILFFGVAGAFPLMGLLFYIGIFLEIMFPLVISIQAWCLIYVIRKSRIAQISAFDNQHKVCRECQYILQGIPIRQGVGRCPECGTKFAKYGIEVGTNS